MPSKSFGSVRIFYPPFRRDEVLALLRQRLARLREKLPLKQVVLFGSYAKGRHTVASDMDLLVVYEGEPREDAYALVKQTLGIRRLEPHVYAEGEYAQLKPTIARMIRDGIPLLGSTEGAADP